MVGLLHRLILFIHNNAIKATGIPKAYVMILYNITDNIDRRHMNLNIYMEKLGKVHITFYFQENILPGTQKLNT